MGGRKAHAERSALQAKAAGPAYITRKIPYFEFADEESLCRIEAHAEWLMQDVGIEFRDDPVVLDIWRAAGADVDGVTVRLPKGMARELCRTIPPEFTQHARNPDKSVRIGGRNVIFAPVYGPPFVRDLEKGRRYGSLEDLQNLIRIASQIPWLHHSGGILVEPCDIPVNKRHLDIVYSHIRYSDKPFFGMITAKDRAEDSVALARILFGEDFVEDNCCVVGNVNANSPLMFDKVATEALRVYSAANQCIIVTPFILSGAMGPVSTAASVAQALAEGMAAGALSQLVRPGSPFVLGNFLSSMSLKSGAPTFGMPEPVMSNYIVGQLARRLNVPLRCGGSLTASKICDAQAAAESGDSMHSTALGGANFVLHAAGWLEGGLCSGYEKLVLDADRLGAYQRMLQGVATDANGLAADAYREVEPGGHFLGCSHTMANYETAFYDAQLSDSESFEQWVETGEQSAEQRAFERWNQMLNDYERPPLDEATDEALREFIDRKKESMPDAWY
ncbi:MAG: trimethylamine methyltransferase family protein [Gammaproteobacteria bacterium]|nr:trimethylamine methyltransferase family protein [Gammaproteobacteria bacterium]